VDHTGSVGFVQSVSTLDGILQSQADRQWSFLQYVGQSLAIEVLHDEVRLAILLAYVMEGANVRVV